MRVGAAVVTGAGEETLENSLPNNGCDSGTGGRIGRPSTTADDTGRVEFAAFCWGLNAFSNPESRTGESEGFTIPVLVGAGGNADEADGDTLIAGREVLRSALLKSN